MSNKGHVGRPKLSEDKVRDVVFQVRLNKEELETIQRAAKRAGKPQTSWARRVLIFGAQLGL